MLAYVFPGQGSQAVGMGKDLFDEFQEYVDVADNILGYSIKELCLEDPNGVLGLTQYTQPALFVVNALTYLKEVQNTGIKPDFVAGHSLGEYNALYAAGVFDFPTGLKLVKKRGELMAEAKNGGMAAVLGLKEEEIRKVLVDNHLSAIDLANLNSPTQTVISGPKKDIEAAKTIFEAAGALKYVVLNVSGAFHSRYMKEAQEKFKVFMDQYSFQKPQIKVISNVYARPYQYKNMKETLLGQITSSVKWTETVRYIWGKDENIEIVQIGPGNVLKSLIRGIKRDCQPLIIDDEEIVSDVTPGGSSDDFEAIDNRNSLGSKLFKDRYCLNYAYAAGPMYCEISSKQFVEKLAKARMLAFYGTAGVELQVIEKALAYLKDTIGEKASYGVNIMPDIPDGERERKIVDLLLQYDVKTVLASFYINLTSELIRYKVNGLKRDNAGKVISTNKVIAKLSRPEVLKSFLSPIPADILTSLLSENKITKEQFELAQNLPVADDICVVFDSAGNTDIGSAYTMLPTMVNLRNDLVSKYQYANHICIGCAGGIGTPDAIVAAAMLGAEFFMTGSINQCTVEAKTSDTVKNMLQEAEIQDTDYIVSGDNFEFGTKSQVFRKGVLFHVRATKLYETYKFYSSIEKIDQNTRRQIEDRYFQKSFDQVFGEIKNSCLPIQLERMQSNSKYKMAMIFKWYYDNGTKLALSGNEERVVDYLINCSSAMGAFNTYVKGMKLENWHNRNVDIIGKLLMEQADELLHRKIAAFQAN